MMFSEFLIPASPVLSLVICATLLILLEAILPDGKAKSTKLVVAILGPFLSLLATLFLLSSQTESLVVLSNSPIPTWIAEFKKSYLCDDLTVNLFTAMSVFVLISIVFLEAFLPKNSEKPEIFSLVLFAGAGMMLLVSAGSLLMVFMALELMSLPTYILVGMQKKDQRSCEAALRYFLYGSFATVLLVLGIALLYGELGTLYVEPLKALLNSPNRIGLSNGRGGSVGVLAAFALMLAGVGFKIGLVPYHLWLPDAYQGAPTSVTGFMGSAIKLAGFGLAIRIFAELLQPITSIWSSMMGFLAALTILVGNFAALRQTNLKRLFAYSSIAHAGYLFLGVVSLGGGEANSSALQYYLWIYGLLFLGIFGILALLETHRKSLELDSLNGLGFEKPLLGFCFLLFTLSAAGIPPTAGFFAKYLILLQAFSQDQIEWVIVAVLGSVIGIAYYLKVISHLYMKAPASPEATFPVASKIVQVTIVLCALAMVYFAVSPTMAQ